MHRFLIVIEKAENSYSAYSADVPRLVALGAIAFRFKLKSKV